MDAATLKNRFSEFNLDPALAEMVEAAPGQQIIEAIVRLEDPDQIPPHFTVVSRFKRICTGRFAAADTWTIRRHPNVVSLKAARPLGIQDEGGNPADLVRAWSTGMADRSFAPFTGRGCIVAALDFGLDFAHPNFLNRDGTTRLVGFWHQGAPYDPARPNRFGYGRIFSRREINAALSASDPYEALGYHPAISDAGGNGSHGTHTMDIAAGNGRAPGAQPGAAPGADLIFVHLSTPQLGFAGDLGDSVRLLEALDAVNSMAQGRPWAVNLSVGRTAGSHDGTSLVEQGMQELLRLGSSRAICQSCGNYRSADLAVQGRLRDGEYRDLEWIIDPADTTANEIDAWYSGRDRFVVGIRAPQGSAFTEVKLGQVADIVQEGALVGRIYHRKDDPNNRDNHIEVFLYPGAPPGVWTVRLSGDYVISGRFHAWIERDLARPGAQSRFARRITSQSYTLGTIATSPLVITVGAYDAHSEGRPLAPFSSCGPTRDERHGKPELLAPGVGEVAARSIPRGAVRQQGLLVARSGTSMAAPRVAGTVCAMFEAAGRLVSIDEIRDCLMRSAEPVADVEHADCCAWGRLNAAGAIRRIRDLKDTDRVSALRRNASEIAGSDAAAEDFSIASMEQENESPVDEGALMNSDPADRFLDRAEHVLRSSYGGRHESETAFLQGLLQGLGSHGSTPGLSPAELFRAVLSNRRSPRDVLEVLAMPSQRPDTMLRRGDWMLRAVPGTGDTGHVAVLASDDLLAQPMLAAEGITAESVQPGHYGPVIEAGAFPHSRARPFARRWLDERGRVPPHTVVLRPRYADPDATADYPEDEESEYPNARVIPEAGEAWYGSETSAWSPGSAAEEAEDISVGDYGEDEPDVALQRAIESGSRDENELTNLIFFARHPELPSAKLDPKDPNFGRLSSEWSSIRDGEVWRAIQASAGNADLVVSGEEVADHHRRFFRGKSGKRLKTLVENAAKEVGLNPGLLGTIMMAETRRPQSYLASEKVSSYHIGADDFFEGRAAIQARVPAYAKVKWDRKQKPGEHLNDAKTNRRVVKTILFDSGPDAVLATAVYVKFREVRLREIATELNGDFDRLPLATQMALTRMAMGAGTGGATRFLKEALKGGDIFVRKAIPVVAYQTQRNATVRTAQAMHLSDWVFGIRVPAAVKPPTTEAFEDLDFAETWQGEAVAEDGEYQDGEALALLDSAAPDVESEWLEAPIPEAEWPAGEAEESEHPNARIIPESAEASDDAEADEETWIEQQAGPAVRARILWPALGFPAVIAPRESNARGNVAGDATRCISLLVLASRTLTPDDVARHLRCVTWDNRWQRHIPEGTSASTFRAAEIAVRADVKTDPISLATPKNRLISLVGFGGGKGEKSAIIGGIAQAVLDFYTKQLPKDQRLPNLHEIRISEDASNRFADGQYHLFWNNAVPTQDATSDEMRLLIDFHAHPLRERKVESYEQIGKYLLEEYEFEYGILHQPYQQSYSQMTMRRPRAEVLHPLFVKRAQAEPLRIGHLTDLHVDVRADVYEANLGAAMKFVPKADHLALFNKAWETLRQKLVAKKRSPAPWRIKADLEELANLSRLPRELVIAIAASQKLTKYWRKDSYNNLNRSFRDNYTRAKGESDILLLTGDLIDYGRGHYGLTERGRLGEDTAYHEDRNWFLFYWLLAGDKSYTVPSYTILGNHDWRLNPYPPFAIAGAPSVKSILNNYEEMPAEISRWLLQIAHGPGHERAFSYASPAAGVRDLFGEDPAAALLTIGKLALNTGRLNIEHTPTETGIASVMWYLLTINPFLDYSFPHPSGQKVLMLDWAEAEDVLFDIVERGKARPYLPHQAARASDPGPKAGDCLTDAQRKMVANFVARPGVSKLVGIHAPPIAPWYDWFDSDLVTSKMTFPDFSKEKNKVDCESLGWKWDEDGKKCVRKSDPRGPDIKSALANGETKKWNGHPFFAIRPPKAFDGMVADYGSLVKGRDEFIRQLIEPNHGVRVVFAGHNHRDGLHMLWRMGPQSGPQTNGTLRVRLLLAPLGRVAPGSSLGPLWVNTTSAGFRGHHRPRPGQNYYVPPGRALVSVRRDGTIDGAQFRRLPGIDKRAPVPAVVPVRVPVPVP